jgi:hypothetical protein
MKSAYKLNQDAIVHLPISFEETLKKVLGKEDANSVINSIFDEIIKEVDFEILSQSNERK